MNAEWIVVEIIAILIENFIFIYFLHNRFNPKESVFLSPWLIWGVFTSWGILSKFLQILDYGVISFIGLFIYLLITKNGTIIQKMIGILIVILTSVGSSILGKRFAMSLTPIIFSNTLLHQDILKLFEILFIQLIQIEIFYFLVKKHQIFYNLKKIPSIVLSGATIINIINFALICIYIQIPYFDMSLFIWLTICFLLTLICLFSIYDLFVREETTNIALSVELHRFELETRFYKEIDAMYTDMRTWKHEYKNNLIALRALVEQEESEKVLKYIDYISCESLENHVTLQTGNLVLDAVVSSKLCLAQSRNIQISVQAVYPENNRIDDSDLCAITGNLLDNAIEACDRMVNSDEKRFINFSLMLKGKSLFILVSNSYNNELKCEGNRYLTLKNRSFHGIGIAYVDSIVNKYQGHVRRFQKLGVFETQIMLPLLPAIKTD